MAIKVQGTTVVDDSRNLVNIVSLSGVDATFTGTSAIKLPTGNTAEQPASPTIGMLRYNTDEGVPEFYNGVEWVRQPTGVITGRMFFLGTNG